MDYLPLLLALLILGGLACSYLKSNIKDPISGETWVEKPVLPLFGPNSLHLVVLIVHEETGTIDYGIVDNRMVVSRGTMTIRELKRNYERI